VIGFFVMLALGSTSCSGLSAPTGLDLEPPATRQIVARDPGGNEFIITVDADQGEIWYLEL